MSVAKGRVLSSLLVALLLAAAAAAQGAPPLVSLLAVPGGGVQVLVTRLDPSTLQARSELLPGGGAPALGAPSSGVSALPDDVEAQRFRSRWVDTAGWKHALETAALPAETPDAHALRHAAALELLVVQFPPAPGVSSVAPALPPVEPGDQVLKTAWKGADDLDHEVLTARKSSESMEKWAERHADGVAAMLKLFPPKPSLAAARGPCPGGMRCPVGVA